VNGKKKKKNFAYLKWINISSSATHFNKLITEYPTQTSSRFTASQWLCAMHNKVNERLKKPEFDCATIEGKYPCGCADEV
jgi:hypothetical protein